MDYLAGPDHFISSILVGTYAALIWAQWDFGMEDGEKYFGPLSTRLCKLAAEIEMVMFQYKQDIVVCSTFPCVPKNHNAYLWGQRCAVLVVWPCLGYIRRGFLCDAIVDMIIARYWTRHRLSSLLPLCFTFGMCLGWVVVGVLGEERTKRIEDWLWHNTRAEKRQGGEV